MKIGTKLGVVFMFSFLTNLVYADDIAIIPCLVGQIYSTGFQHEEILTSGNKYKPRRLIASQKDETIDLASTCREITTKKVKSKSPVLILLTDLTFSGFFYLKGDELYLVSCPNDAEPREMLYTSEMALEHRYDPNRREMIKKFLLKKPRRKAS